ncbi:MAG: VOC family protein, partial [Calditrichia bacterium]
MNVPFKILGIDYIEFIVGNAKQAAHYYHSQLGFTPFAYSGLETGERDKVSYGVRQNKIVFILTSPLMANSALNVHLMQHGDGVRDVAFTVDNAAAAWEYAIRNGARSYMRPEEQTDEDGSIIRAAIRTYGDTIHT